MREAENAQAKTEYVLGNPLRAGLVTNPFDYRWLWTESGVARSRGRPCLHTLCKCDYYLPPIFAGTL